MLLCDAMGWSLAHSSSDENPDSVSRPVAVVQTDLFVLGTNDDVMSSLSYVACAP